MAQSVAAAISVILPNFNHGRFLDRAVGALLSQELPPSEILIIDDGSTDDSLTVIDRLAKASPLIRAMRNEKNIGVVSTQRLALEAASGDYVILAAADDWVLPGFFSQGAAMLHRYPQAGLFCGDAVVVDGITNRTLGIRPAAMPRFRSGPVEPAKIRCMLNQSDNWILTGAALIRRDALIAAGGLDDELGSFADGFLVRKIALMRGICYAPRPVITWRVFGSGYSRQTSLDLGKARDHLERSQRKISSDAVFPSGYAERYCDRWRFGTARLALQYEPADLQVIGAIGARNEIDRCVVNFIGSTTSGGPRRMALLLWLWVRLRPYRLIDLIASWLIRRFWYRYS